MENNKPSQLIEQQKYKYIFISLQRNSCPAKISAGFSHIWSISRQAHKSAVERDFRVG